MPSSGMAEEGEVSVPLESAERAMPKEESRPLPFSPYSEGDQGRRWEEDQGYGRPREVPPEVANLLLGPAIGLLVTGILSLLVQGFFLMHTAAYTPEMVLQSVPPPPDPAQREGQELFVRFLFGRSGTVFQLISLAMSLMVSLGGVAMAMRKFRGLAIMGSILAIVNLSWCCFLLGLPMGVWSLIVLFRPEVAEVFQ